jgi:dTDP-4-amino-4,6-dideoxygalactose transaminase
MIPFNKPYFTGKEVNYIRSIYEKKDNSPENKFYTVCTEKLKQITSAENIILTGSCTSALEMTALLIGIKKGDEVIMSSFTYPSTANAFALRGAKIVFVDIKPDTLNIDENKIEAAITKNTKAIIAMHYGGISCEMEKIMEIADRYKLFVIEDAAHSIVSYYDNKHLGTRGHFGCLSFDETKNIHCGKGGALIINDKLFFEHAEIIADAGTNRSAFIHGKSNFYTWTEIGSSYRMSENQAAFLAAQLEIAEKLSDARRNQWKYYYSLLEKCKGFDKPVVSERSTHNGHIFYIMMKDKAERDKTIKKLKEYNISAVFHFIPLHSSPAGKKYGRFNGKDIYTTSCSERIIRLPLFNDLWDSDIEYICDKLIRIVG